MGIRGDGAAPRLRAPGAAILLALALTLSACASPVDPLPAPSSTAAAPQESPSIPTPTRTATPVTPEPGPAPDGASDPDTGPDGSPDADDRAQAAPFVASVEWDEGAARLIAWALVPSINEEGGTCTLYAQRGDTVRVGTSDAIADAQSTDCGELSIAGSALSAGTWKVWVGYESRRSVGLSDSSQIEVTS